MGGESGFIPDHDFRLPDGYSAAYYDSIDSTNAEAKRGAAEGMRGNHWCIAAQQTAGRGRRGREWVSDKGNLFASLLLRPKCGVEQAAQLSFVAGLAVADAILSITKGDDADRALRLKWPNDVLFDGKKISGILLESSALADGRVEWVVIGIGINVAHHPTEAAYPTTSLADEGLWAGGPGPVFEALAAATDDWLGRWRRHGFPVIRSAWVARAAFLGERITISAGGEPIAGKFGGLSEDGALILELDDQTIRTIAAGDVFPAVQKEN